MAHGRLISGLVGAVTGASTILALTVTPLAGATAQTCTWTGALSNKFSVAGNWSNCNGTVPQNGDNLSFDITNLSSSQTVDNDMTGLSVGTLTFQGTYDANYDSYTLSGNELGVASIQNSGDAYANLALNLKLTADLGITSGIYLDNTSGNQTVNLNGHNLTIGGDTQQWMNSITGTGNVTVNSYAVLAAANNGWSGNLNVGPTGGVEVLTTGGLNRNMSVTVASGGSLNLCVFKGASVAASLTVAGNGSGTGAVVDSKACESGGPGIPDSNADVNWTGPITLTGNTLIGGSGDFTISGPLSGNYTIKQEPGTTGKVTVSSSANTSKTPNGVQTSPTVTTTYKSSNPTQFISVAGNNVALVDGTYGDVDVASQGVLKGFGSVGAVTVESGATIAPGHSPGCLTTKDMTLAGTYQAELGGSSACTGYDQLKVNGTVNLNGAQLETVLYKGYQPATGSQYTIIKNDGNDAVQGTFAGLKQGATFNLDGYLFKINYKGGDGNDVVLTVLNVPSAPNTGHGVYHMSLLTTLLSYGTAAIILFGSALAVYKYASRYN